MTEDRRNREHEKALTEALAMLDAFASVGATQFDVTWTTLAGKKDGFRRGVQLTELAPALPTMLGDATRKQRNLIVRPHSAAVTFIQLDDLATTMLARLAPAVFLALQTSPGNFQAWIAIDGPVDSPEDKDFASRLRKGTGADATASGATRVAGSLNFKEKYASNFPRVAIHAMRPGVKAGTAELKELGLVAPPKAPAPRHFPPTRNLTQPRNRRWPDYVRCVEGAPLNSDKSGPDISRADFVWCMTAIDWGWSVDATAARLIEESSKARENGEKYASLTARNAALAVERGRDRRPLDVIETPQQG